jgi:hypothetical protein
MAQELKRLTEQEILKKIKRLEPKLLAEVVDFLDFLAERKSKEHPFVQFLKETSGPGVKLEEVRRRLSKISGKMSETVRELRDERI